MLEAIWKRQSIRKYQDRPVEKEKIEELLRAAMNATTARNTQSLVDIPIWHILRW